MIIKRLKKLSFRSIFLLTGVLIKKPYLILPTYKGTARTIKTCNDCFGKKHHGDNRSNAFRHALWNYLICKQCFKITNSMEKAILWSKKITDLHEELSPNSKLAKEMDLHNNFIGRQIFAEHREANFDYVKKIQQLTDEAVKISSLEDIKSSEKELVYIED